MRKSNVKVSPIILENLYKLEKIHREDCNIKRETNFSCNETIFGPQLEKWICNQICGRDNVMLIESIRMLHKFEILNIRDYMMERLSGHTVNNEQLKSCFIETLVELNLDIKELRKIDKEKLSKIKNSSLYKRK